MRSGRFARKWVSGASSQKILRTCEADAGMLPRNVQVDCRDWRTDRERCRGFPVPSAQRCPAHTPYRLRPASELFRRHTPPCYDTVPLRRPPAWQHQPVAAQGGHHGECDASAATGRFDQHVVRSYACATRGPSDHRKRRAILDRTRGVVALQLAEDDVVTRPDCFVGKTNEFDQRGVANDGINGSVGHVP